MPIKTNDITSPRYPAAWGLYSAMFALLSLERGPMTVKDFSTALDMRHNTAHVVVRRLESAGLFEIVGEDTTRPTPGPTPLLWALSKNTPREWVRDVTNRYRRVLSERGFPKLADAGDKYVRS